MTNTQQYYKTIVAFRDGLREINSRYASEYARLEKFKDSKFYNDDKKLIDDRRKAETDNLRREYAQRLADVVDSMEKTYMERPASAPTQEQLAILQALKMRDTVGRDELRQAAISMRGCPLAERTLEEIARKSGHALALANELSGDEIRQHLQSLRVNGSKLISKLEVPDSRREHVNSGNYDLFRLDIDPQDEADAMRVFGCVTDPGKFSEAVNAEKG